MKNNLLIVIMVLCFSTNVYGDKKLFKSDIPLRLTLTAPLALIYSERDKSKTYSHAKLSFVDDEKKDVNLDIGLRVRGNFRLNKKNCSNPPLKFVIGKNAKGTYFSKQKELKLVLPCKRRPRYQEFIYLEYLSYKIYNLLSEDSYRVRLAELTLVDSDNRHKTVVYDTFFIEPHKRLAKRIKKAKLGIQRVKLEQLESRSLAVQNLFQYMIANTDFSTLTGAEGETCCHNVKLFKGKTDTKVLAIPYDFDSTGLVNAPYAVPGRAVKISSVKTRRYRGFCEQNDHLKQAIPRFNETRKEIIALFKNMKGLSPKATNRALKYLDRFYETINNPEMLQKKILKRCR